MNKRSILIGSSCCPNIELVYTTDTYEETHRSERFGKYTLTSEIVNGRGYYVSDFDEGAYGIWWSGDKDGSWRIAPVSKKGQSWGLRAHIDEQCVESVYPWEYYPSGGPWTSFGSMLTVNCISSE